jgi:uncharacterized protein (TIGR02271 family)
MAEGGDGRSGQMGEWFAGYQVYDRHYEKVGKVEHVYVDESDRLEYVGVKTGFFGTHSTLIPMSIVRVNDERQLMEVNSEKDTITNSPTFQDDGDITPEFEDRIYANFGLTREGRTADRGGYGAYYADQGHRTGAVGHSDAGYGERATFYDLPIEAEGTDATREGASRERAYGRSAGEVGPGMRMGDTETGEFRGHASEQEGTRQPGSDLEDRDELRVQRSEEELRVGTREREAGRVNVRKRVRVEREQVRVPTRREEVTVERVPVEGLAAPEAEIGGGEVQIPVVEEEIVVEKRPVVREELRIRKDVVEDEEVVEADLRKEEVDVYDETTRRRSAGESTERRDK